jgi:hypothetical protein
MPASGSTSARRSRKTLALCVNPYPRSAEADATLRQAGVLSEEDAAEQSGPFAALAALRTKGG